MKRLRVLKIFVLLGLFVSGLVSSCSVCSCSPAGAYLGFGLHNTISLRVINQSEPLASVQLMQNLKLTIDESDDQTELLNFDEAGLLNEILNIDGTDDLTGALNESKTVLSITDDHPVSILTDEYCLDFYTQVCEKNVSTFALKITFNDGREVLYAGWDESIQSAPGYEAFGLGYSSFNQQTSNIESSSTLVEQDYANAQIQIMVIITQSEHISIFVEKNL